MTARSVTLAVLGLLTCCAIATISAAGLSRQQADLFQQKIDVISRQGDVLARQRVGPDRAPVRRTQISETELNSWFTYRAQPLLPQGVANPAITIVGSGKVMGNVIVDLGVLAKAKSSGGTLDPLSYLGGRVPVTVSGVLQTDGGRGRFDLQSADVSGVPLPKPMVQQLLSYYSRTADNPSGIRLDDPFELPAGIQKIEVGAGQAVVVQ